MNTSHIERPKLRQIPGTDLACIIAPTGVKEKNGYDKFIDYLASKTDGVIVSDSNTHRTLREYGMKIYKMQGRTIEELEQAVKSNNAILVGDTIFSAVNQDLTYDELDDLIIVGAQAPERGKRNLLLKSYGSDLEDIGFKCGDVLISDTGEILKMTYGTSVMHEIDVQTGYYYEDIFTAKGSPMFGDVNIVGMQYNFVDPNGVVVRKQNFDRTEEPTLHILDRTYRDDSEDKLFLSKDVYPKSYVFDGGKHNGGKPRYFPSPAHLLMEHRIRMQENPNATPMLEDEVSIIAEHYLRQKQIPVVMDSLTKKYAAGTISVDKYKRAMSTLDAERRFNQVIFAQEFETEDDRAIEGIIERGEYWTNEEGVLEF